MSLFILLFLITILGCSDLSKKKTHTNGDITVRTQEVKDLNNNIDRGTPILFDNYINVRFIQSGTTYPFRLDCGMIDLEKNTERIFFKKIKDSFFITQFKSIYDSLKTSTKITLVDMRITAFVHLQEKKTDTLCFGENFGLMLNGVHMKDNPKLLKLLKDKIAYENTFVDPIERFKLSAEEIIK